MEWILAGLIATNTVSALMCYRLQQKWYKNVELIGRLSDQVRRRDTIINEMSDMAKDLMESEDYEQSVRQLEEAARRHGGLGNLPE